MSLDWPSAALRSLALSLSNGRPAWERIWLCRQRIAARTSSRFCGVGITSVFWHGTAAAVALTLTGFFLAPRATWALIFVSLLWAAPAVGAAISRPAAIAAAVKSLECTAATSLSRVCRVGGGSRRPDVPCGTNPSVARLAQGAPWLCAPSSRTVCLYREVEPLVALLIGSLPKTFSPLR